MYVSPDQRGRKLGESLLRAAIETAESHHARVLQLVTHDKEDFYERYHFTPLRRIPGLIGGADMTVMELKLG
jgi:predicted N-acetyltransferase YhbS